MNVSKCRYLVNFVYRVTLMSFILRGRCHYKSSLNKGKFVSVNSTCVMWVMSLLHLLIHFAHIST